MSQIQLPEAEKAALLRKIQNYFEDELDYELGQFDAEFLLDFFVKELASVTYNQGLYDAQAVVSAKIDTIQDAILALEK